MKKIFLLFILIINLYANTIEMAKDLFDKQKKYKEAIEIFGKFKNDSESQYYLGKAYYFGMGVDKDLKKAFYFAKKSADKNNSSGLNLLGVMYQNGEGVEKDELKAFNFYKESAKMNNEKAMFNLAKLYANIDSNFFKKDLNQTLFWLMEIFNMGKVEYAYQIALTYIEMKDYDNAIKYFNYLIEQESANSYVYLFLGDIYLDKKLTKEAYYNYIKSAELGNSDAILKLIYEKDLSEEKHLYWMKKGVDMKLELSYLPLYKYYIEKKDFKNLKSFLEKSYYEDENLEMGCSLSSYYLNLINIQPEKADFKKAYEIAKEIVNNNSDNKDIYICYQNIAYLYKTGKHVAKDLQKAIDILQKAIEVSPDFVKASFVEDIKDIEVELGKKTIIQNNTKKGAQEIFPILNNFSNKEQVYSALESNDYYFISTSNKSIRIYDKENLKFIKELRSWISQGVEGSFLNMAYDEMKHFLYTSSLDSTSDISKNNIIRVFDINNGKIIKTINNSNTIKNTYLNISDDGKYLISINGENRINIINTLTDEIQYYNYENKDKFSKAIIKKTDTDYLIYLLSINNDLYTVSLNERKTISVQAFSNRISFNKIFKKNYNYSIFDRSKIFNNDSNDILNFNFINNLLEVEFQNYNKKFDLNKAILEGLNIFDKRNLTKENSFIKVNQKYNGELIEIENLKTKTKKEYLIENSSKVLKTLPINNQYLLLVTSDIGSMLISNVNGDIIAKLEGFNSIQENIFFENNKLISFGKDNIIHIFDLKNMDNIQYDKSVYDKDALKGMSSLAHVSSEEFIDNIENNLEKEFDGKVLKNSLKLSFVPTFNQLKNMYEFLLSKKEIIKPIASLYIKDEKDWILYTPEGLFTYGGNGKDLLKYHQNQGLDKEAKIIENDRLFDKFYRPDLIKKILAGEKVDIPINVKSVILNIFPPELRILVNKMIDEKNLDITYQVCDAGNGISDPKLIINGQAINPPSSRGFTIEKIEQKDNCSTYRSIHTLDSGNNTIEFKAYDKEKNIANVSEKLEIETNYENKKNIYLKSNDQIEEIDSKNTNLYFLSIAVSDYENDNLDLKYPTKDVEAVKSEFIKKSKKVFENIFTFKLNDTEVTKESFDKIFDDIAGKIKYDDTFVLYIAGHGLTKEGKYQFLSYKINNSISIDDLKYNLSKIYVNKSLVLLDTCQSGAVIEDIDAEATKNRLAHDSNKVNYIVASSSNQVALEGFKDHGVFTYTVLDAFENNANLKVGKLADHILDLVPKITQDKFKYEQIPQYKLNTDFLLFQ